MQDNKQYILILIALLVLGGLGFYFVSSNSTEDTSTPESAMMETAPAMDADKMMAEDSMAADDSDSMMMETMEAPEGATAYMITEGTASYTVQKEWLEKPIESVTGTTEDVGGQGWLSADDGSLYVMANADLAGLVTGSDARDKDVAAMWDKSTVATLMLELDTSTITLGEEFTLEAPAMLTINDVEQEVTFAVTGTVTEEGFTATGTGDILITDFGVTPPTVAGLYGVADEASVSFEVTGQAN